MNIAVKATADPWAWWKEKIAGGNPPAIVEDPQCGYYRIFRKGQAPSPVCIYPNELGELVCVIDGAEINPDRMGDTWSWCNEHPITEEVYRLVAEEGGKWPDLDAFVAAQLERDRHGVGGNIPPKDEVVETREQIAAAREAAAKYAKITSDELQTMAQTLRASLLKLAREAKNRHAALKAPHWEKVKEIDAAWLPLVKDAEQASEQLRRAMEAWEDEKRKKVEAERRAAEAIRIKAEAERKAAEDRAVQQANDAAARGEEAPPPVDLPEVPLVPAAAPAQTQIKGAYGKAANVKLKATVTAITDVVACATHFRDTEALKACLMKLAQAQVDFGNRDVPGCTVEDKTRVR